MRKHSKKNTIYIPRGTPVSPSLVHDPLLTPTPSQHDISSQEVLPEKLQQAAQTGQLRQSVQPADKTDIFPLIEDVSPTDKEPTASEQDTGKLLAAVVQKMMLEETTEHDQAAKTSNSVSDFDENHNAASKNTTIVDKREPASQPEQPGELEQNVRLKAPSEPERDSQSELPNERQAHHTSDLPKEKFSKETESTELVSPTVTPPVTETSQTTLACLVSYRGDAFAGFARQPKQLTVQGEIEHALSLIFRHEVNTTCAGRTDSGVHALGQVVSFTILESEVQQRSTDKLLRSLNALTHDDISIRTVTKQQPGFSARFSATMREYRYFISNERFEPLFLRDFSWHVPKPLNLNLMQQASSYLVGEHDFKSFCMAASAKGKNTNRFVESITITEEELLGESVVVITVRGNAFLHSMVRTIVGSLVAVGTGNRPPEWIKEVLDAKNRSAAGENAPAKGLVFWHVSYGAAQIGEKPHVYKKKTKQKPEDKPQKKKPATKKKKARK